LGGEIAFRQRVDGNRIADVDKAVADCHFDQHARRPVCARPDHAGIDRDITRLDAMRNSRPIARPAEIRFGDAADNRDRRWLRRGGQQVAPCQSTGAYRASHRASPVESRRRMPVVFDSGSTNLRLFSESRYAEPICSTEGSEKVLPIEGKAFALLSARFTRASY